MCKKVIKEKKWWSRSERRTKTRKLAVIAEDGCDGTFGVPQKYDRHRNAGEKELKLYPHHKTPHR